MGANTVVSSSNVSGAFVAAKPPLAKKHAEKGLRATKGNMDVANAYKVANPYCDGMPFTFPIFQKKEDPNDISSQLGNLQNKHMVEKANIDSSFKPHKDHQVI